MADAPIALVICRPFFVDIAGKRRAEKIPGTLTRHLSVIHTLSNIIK